MRRAPWALAAAAVAAASLLAPPFRAPDGDLAIGACLALAAAVGLALVATFPPDRYGRAGLWLALAALGQGAVLQLTRAGPTVGYQHLLAPDRWLGSPERIVACLILALQLGLVARAGRDLPGRLLGWARSHLPGWRLAAALALFVLTAATLSADPGVYALELALAAALQTLMLLTVVLAGRDLPAAGAERVRRAAARWLGPDDRDGGRSPLRPDRVAWAAALWTFAVAVTLAVVVWERHPHIPDEVAYLFHAKTFAAGRLWLEAPPAEEAFRLGLVAMEDGRWYSPVPPAWPAALAAGERLGAAFLVSPVLAALDVLLAFGLLGYLYGRRTARLGVTLLAASPWFLFLAMSYMTHAFSLAAALAAAWCAVRLREGASVVWAVPGGVAIGIVGLTRPLEGLIVAGLLGLWVLSGPRPAILRRAARVAALAAATVATAALTLPYNETFTGDPLTFPLIEYTDGVYGPGTNALGFGPDRGLGWSGLDPLPGHGIPDIFINGNLNLYGVNVELLGWSCGSLLIVLLGTLIPGRRRRDWWMIAAIAAVIGAHSFYWFSGGPDFGARYWFLTLLPLLALAARGLETLGHRIPLPHAPERVAFAAFGLVVGGLAVFMPWRSVEKYHEYRGMRPDVRRIAAETDFGDGLVLVRGRHFPDYQSAAVYNPPDLDAPGPIYAWDAGPDARRELAAAFPERPVWILEGPQRTGDGFRVIAGPLPPGSTREMR